MPTTEPPESVKFGPSLTVAEEWIRETGRETKRDLSPPLPDGKRIPLLVISHGLIKVLAREQGSCLIVSVAMPVHDAIRKKLSGLTPEDKQKVMIALRGELSSNSRGWYGYSPADATSLDQMQSFYVEQLLKVSKDDPSSFNRLCDAIQEVVGVAVKGLTILGFFAQPQSPPTSPVKPASTSLYS